MTIDELAQEIYADNVAAGWWDDPDRDPLVCLQLISTEIAEATEGERKNLMDDHLPHRRMGEVELADALIRTLDFGGRYGLTYVPQQSVVDRRIAESTSTPACHYYINRALFDFGSWFETLYDEAHYSGMVSITYSALVGAILAAGKRAGYDIEGAMAEKRAYNKTRADHTRQARAAENGKKF